MPQQPPKYILLVDDEKDFIEPISFWLRSKGYDVAMASDGRQALDAISARRPDIVFMDINMPGQGG
ncbi:MAG: response regulator, partial [Candidatus Omnitrophica bacterium]|nr:response regulator [Candidatus Omnitrophota bacterium]